jgi:hypothetical protein
MKQTCIRDLVDEVMESIECEPGGQFFKVGPVLFQELSYAYVSSVFPILELVFASCVGKSSVLSYI